MRVAMFNCRIAFARVFPMNMSLSVRKGTSWQEIPFSGNSLQKYCVIHRPCADSNVHFIPNDQYALMQELFTMTNLMKRYMFLIATLDHFCFHGNHCHNFNNDST